MTPEVTNSPPPRIARKYLQRRSSISLPGVILGLVLGLVAGLYYTWYINPPVEFDTQPWQLNADDKPRYIAAITLSYAQDGDLNRAVNRLLSLRLEGDPIQAVADAACSLAERGYGNTANGLREIRSMMRFYQLQGRVGCADTLIPADTLPTPTPITIQLGLPTETLTPPPSKTPTPESVQAVTPIAPTVIIPTAPPLLDFDLATINTFCDPARSGIIEVFVYAANGTTGLPGQEIRVRWVGGESRFFSGLKPERGPAYADFQMESGVEYTLDMPGRSEAVGQTLSAIACSSESGARALRSYRVAFRASG
jgi:hypothetical protein